MSKVYAIEITETLQRVVKIKADSEKDAIAAASQLYDNESVVLDADDRKDTDFSVDTELTEYLNRDEGFDPSEYNADDIFGRKELSIEM